MSKPEIIVFYNKWRWCIRRENTKISWNRRTKLWPVAMFYSTVDISTMKWYTLCFQKNLALRRSDFIKDLGYETIRPYLLQHLEMPNFRFEIRKLRDTVKEPQGNGPTTLGLNNKLITCPYQRKSKIGYKCVT
jgi:hypothetical protein